MATTPPPALSRHGRAHTPQSPKHGALHDDYQPWSPRRSTRGTSNPYSTNSVKRSVPVEAVSTPRADRLQSPPTTLKSRRTLKFESPSRRKSHLTANELPEVYTSDSDAEAFQRRSSTKVTLGMLHTPSKTPMKRRPATSSARSKSNLLHIHLDRPEDAMPTRKDVQRQRNRRQSLTGDFDVYDEASSSRLHKNAASVDVYTDLNARVPQPDDSDANPFWGRNGIPRTSPARRSQRKSNKSQEQVEEEQRMQEAADRGEGIIFTFRGRKTFKYFEDSAAALRARSGGSPELGRRQPQAGRAAERPLTRSNIKPRRLFADILDEEAPTDIEMEIEVDEEVAPLDADLSTVESSFVAPITPIKETAPLLDTKQDAQHLDLITPPRTTRATRRFMSSPDSADEHETLSLSQTSPTQVASARKSGRRPTPFDSWARTKGNKKRESDAMVGGIGAVSPNAGKRAKGSRA